MEHDTPSNNVAPETGNQSPPIPPAPNNPAPQHTEQVADAAAQQRITDLEDRIRRGEKWMIWLTGAIAFFALCQLGVGWLQYHYGGEQTDKIIAADERLAKAMEDTVKQGQRAFDSANQQAILTQRAWMKVEATIEAPNGMWAAGQPFLIRTNKQNTGRTPALNVRSDSRIQNVAQTNRKLTFPKFSFDNYHYSGNIVPGESSYSDITGTFRPEDRQDVLSHKTRTFVFGRIEYDDVFGVHHWLTYCSYLLVGGAFATCDRNNEMDNNSAH